MEFTCYTLLRFSTFDQKYKEKIATVIKNSDLTGAVKGVSNNNRMFIVEHVQKQLLYFAKKIPEKQRTLKLWEKLTGQMFEHSQGEQVTGYVCPVYACPKRCFMENNRDEKKPIEKLKKTLMLNL